jgi:hypothetical protein
MVIILARDKDIVSSTLYKSKNIRSNVTALKTAFKRFLVVCSLFNIYPPETGLAHPEELFWHFVMMRVVESKCKQVGESLKLLVSLLDLLEQNVKIRKQTSFKAFKEMAEINPAFKMSYRLTR